MRDMIFITAISILALVGFRRPSFGLMTFVFLGFFNPHSFTWGIGRTFPASQVIAISTLIGMLLSTERKALTVQRETVWLVMLWVFFGISTIFALYPVDALDRYINISKIFLMIVIATILINSRDRLFSLIRIIGYSLGFYAIKGGVFAVVSGGNSIVYGPENSFLYANNSIGLALAMNIPILLYLLKHEKITQLRWMIKAMLFLSYPAIICTYSRGAWLGLGTVTLVSVLKSRNKFIMVGAAAVVAMLLTTIAPMIAPDNLVRRYDSLVNYETESSAQSRFWNWEFCKRVGMARPLVGGGFDYYSLESYAKFYPEFQERWPGKVWSCHSSWLTVFGEHGFPGAVVWLVLLGSSLMALTRFRFHARNMPELPELGDFVDMIKSSFVGYFVVATFLDAAYFDLYYYLIAFIIIQKGIVAGVLRSRGLANDRARFAANNRLRHPVGIPAHAMIT